MVLNLSLMMYYHLKANTPHARKSVQQSTLGRLHEVIPLLSGSQGRPPMVEIQPSSTVTVEQDVLLQLERKGTVILQHAVQAAASLYLQRRTSQGLHGVSGIVKGPSTTNTTTHKAGMSRHILNFVGSPKNIQKQS
jgi:hypothetical protein